MVQQLQTYDLAQVTDEYLIQRGIRNKKYYASFLDCAKLTWRDLFKNTIYAVQSEWMVLKKGEPYNYVDVPIGMQRLFTVSVTNHCGNIIPLKYANQLNIIPKPISNNNCGCGGCDCSTGGLCQDVGSLTKITRLLFTINGVDYNEVTWLEVCPNGDIKEFRQIPVKKYNTFIGDGGDYNSDYSNDYLTENPPFTDYTIVTENFQKVLCKLDVKPCGCPANTTENTELFLLHCRSFCQPFAPCLQKKEICNKVNDAVNYDNCLGEVKMSECGTRIYYIPHRNHHNVEPILPKHLLVNFQTSGENCNSTVRVPEFSLECMFYGIDFRSKRFSGSLNFKEKQAVKYEYIDAQNKLILYLSPFNLENLAQVQDIVIRN